MKLKKKQTNSGHNITICFNLLHVSLSVPLLVFAVFFIPYFNVLRSYFYVFLDLMAVPALLILINCPHDTAFFKFSLVLRVLRIAGRWSSGTSSNVFFLPGPNIG